MDSLKKLRGGLLTLLLLLLTVVVGCGRVGLETELSDAADDGASEGGGDGAVVDSGVVSISVDPATVTLPLGTSEALTAKALLSDGTTVDVTATAIWSSDTTNVTVATGKVTAVAAGTAHVRATYAGVYAESTITVPSAKVTSITLDPGSAETTVGGTATFTATALFDDGSSADVTASATWAVDDAGIAKVLGGVVTGVAAGSTTVRATVSGVAGTAKLTVTAKTLSSLEVSPFGPSVGVGVTLPLVATAVYTDGSKADVTTSATWSSSDDKIAKVDATGLLTGVSGGTATLTAAFGGKTATTTVTVTTAAVSSISISPSAATLAISGTVKLVATGTYADGTTSDLTASAVWTSSAPTVAAVSTGTVTGLAVGSATVTASFGGKSGAAVITVSAAKLLSITVAPLSGTLPMGTTLSFKATGLYEGGASRDITADVTWSTDDTAVATISNAAGTAGRASPVAVGATTVRAKLDGVEGSASLSVTAAGVTSITIAPSALSMVRGTKQFATATANYSDGTTADVSTKCTWATASTAIANVSNGSGSQGLVTAVAVGSTNLSCTLSGVTGTASITVTAPTVETISISPVAPTCHLGETLRFIATAISSSGTGRDVTNTATWTVSPTGMLTATGRPGEFRCAAKGTGTITASNTGVSGSTPITVTDAVVVGVQVDPVTLSLPKGGTQAYTATAIYSDGSTVNVTNLATWSSSAPAVAGITAGGGGPGGPGGPGGGAGNATALTAGTTTIKATYSGFTGTATLTVTDAVLVSVSVTPNTSTQPVGVTFPYTATATYSDGSTKVVTTAASWTSSSTSIAQVSDAGPTRGQATTLAAGTTTITAYFGGFTGKATLTVTAATLTGVTITPATSSISVGSTIVLKAYAVYSDGSKVDVTTSAVWSSADATIVTVSSVAPTIGQATALKSGTTSVKAVYKTSSGSASVTVL